MRHQSTIDFRDHEWHLDPEALLQQERYKELLSRWLILHENIFLQYSKQLLDQSVYNAWENDLAYTVRKHQISVLYRTVEDMFPGEFGRTF